MAGEVKFGKKAAEEVIDLLKQAKSGDQLEAVARKTGFDVEILDEVTKKGVGKGGVAKGKDLLKSVVEKLGGTIESVQTEVNTLLGRTRDVSGGQVPPSAKGAVEMTGPVDATKGKGFQLTGPSPYEKEPRRGSVKALVPVFDPGPKKQIPYMESEIVEEASPRMSKLSETAQQALVPVPGTMRGTVDNRIGIPKNLADEASSTKALVPVSGTRTETPNNYGTMSFGDGRGVREWTPGAKVSRSEEFRTQAERSADFGLDLDLSLKPDTAKLAKGAKRAGLGLGIAGIASGFSKEANAPTTIAAAQVDKIEDVQDLADKAEAQGAVTPEQKTVLQGQAEQLEAAAQSIEDKLTSDYEKKKARVELMQLTETIMNGLVTAIGANALLNRGSPYAVDFSKGPKTDWAGEFDRLQKDYATQMGAIMQKYKLEAQEKRAQAREEAQESRFQRSLEMREKELEARQGQAAGTAEQKAQEKAAAAKDKAFAELSGALASLKEKSTPITIKQVETNATKLGIPKEERDLLISKTTGKGLFNLADEDKVVEILEKYRPGQQAEAAPAAPSDADAKRRRLEELRAKKSGG